MSLERAGGGGHCTGTAAPGLLEERWQVLGDCVEGGPQVCYLRFDARAFEPRAFGEAGLPCPPSIEGSIGKRQAEFFYGRLAARLALASLGQTIGELPIGANRAPVWPPGVLGSISHCAGLAAAVAVPAHGRRGIGIDIEHVVDDGLACTLRRGVLSAEEQLRLERYASPDLPLNELLTVAFSAKESLFKAAYSSVGRFFGFEAAEFLALDAQARLAAFEITEDLCPSLGRGQVCWLSFNRLPTGEVFTSWAW